MTRSIYVCAVLTNEAYHVSDGDIEVVVPHSPDLMLLYSRQPFAVHLTGKIRFAQEIEITAEDFSPRFPAGPITVRVAPCHRL